MLGVRRAREIRSRTTLRMDFWERGLHAVLVRDAEAEGSAREGRDTSGRDEEDEAVDRIYHATVL